MRRQKQRNSANKILLSFLVFAVVACNALAGIESGKLGSCTDGSRIDVANCDDAGPSGMGGTTSSETGANGSSGNGPGGSCNAPWQRNDPVSGACYLQEYMPRDWASAEQRCVDLGGHLIAIDSPNELGFVGEWIGTAVWIGGTDAKNEGEFVWTNGQEWTFASWKDGMPDDPGGNRDCVMLATAFGSLPVFDSRLCTEKRPYVCERAPNNP